MSRFRIFTSNHRSLDHHASSFKRSVRPFEHQPTAETYTSRFFHTKIASKRNQCKKKTHLTSTFPVEQHKSRQIKRTIQRWRKNMRHAHARRKELIVTDEEKEEEEHEMEVRPPPPLQHRRSLYRVVSNSSVDSGYDVVSIEEGEENVLYRATRRLPTDVVRYLIDFVCNETFWCLPNVNRRIHYLFPPNVWRAMTRPRVDKIVGKNLEFVWDYSCRRTVIQPCNFGRPLHMQSFRGHVAHDGTFVFCGNERTGRLTSIQRVSSVSIVIDRVFEWRFDEEAMRSGQPITITCAHFISTIGHLSRATEWQRLVLRRFVKLLPVANRERAPRLMESSTLGARRYVLPAGF